MEEIEDKIFDAIKTGKAKMRPKSYFVLQAILVVTGTVLLFAGLLYLASFVIFVLRQNDTLSAAGFGVSGWYLLFRSLPWSVLLLSIALVLILALLLRRYAFVYQRPLVYFLFGVLIFTALGSFFLAATSFQSILERYASQNNVPLMGGFYRFEDAPPPEIHSGDIILLGSGGFVIQEPDGETSTVFFAPGTPSQFSDNFQTGDLVVVFGDREPNGIIDAFGIQKIGP